MPFCKKALIFVFKIKCLSLKSGSWNTLSKTLVLAWLSSHVLWYNELICFEVVISWISGVMRSCCDVCGVRDQLYYVAWTVKMSSLAFCVDLNLVKYSTDIGSNVSGLPKGTTGYPNGCERLYGIIVVTSWSRVFPSVYPVLDIRSLLLVVIFEHTCAYARWAHMHRFLSVCPSVRPWLDQKFRLDNKSLDQNSVCEYAQCLQVSNCKLRACKLQTC